MVVVTNIGMHKDMHTGMNEKRIFEKMGSSHMKNLFMQHGPCHESLKGELFENSPYFGLVAWAVALTIIAVSHALYLVIPFY